MKTNKKTFLVQFFWVSQVTISFLGWPYTEEFEKYSFRTVKWQLQNKGEQPP